MRGTLSPGSTAHRLRLAVLALALCCGEAAGDAALQFSVADIVGDGWRASGVTFSLQRDDGGRLAARVSAASLELPPPIGRREALAGECRDLVITPRRFTCNELSLGQAGSALPQILLRGRIDYRRDTGALDWDLALPAEQAGDLRLVGRLDAEGWVLDLVAGGWPIEHLGIFGELFGLEPPALAGRLELSFFARGRDTGLQGMVFDLIASDLSGSNDAGTIAAEGLRLALRGSAWANGDRLAFDIRGHAATGEAYVEPVYASLEDYPVRLSARGLAGEHDIILSQLVVEQQDTLHADASARLQRATEGSWQLSHARVKLPRAELPGAYTVLLQPFLTGTPLGDLDSSGVLRGEVTLSHGRLQEARLELVRVNLDDQDGRLAVYDLSGDLAWNAAGHAAHAEPAGPLQLRWSGGFVYGIPFGASSVGLEWRDGLWSLLEPVSIPLLDGALEIDTIELGDFAAGDDTLLFDARLTPVSMRELSHALHWPPLSGQLSGTLPRLRHADGVVALGGEFTAELFGGSMAIRELRIERLLQPRARLRADLELRQLDLAELTEAFAFGLMTGRLEGYVRGLEMIDWAPVAFDARLQTPPGDRSRKRISQRAVDNIASIGGGGAGMLSTGFLRFFESFSYEAFALGCRLENDICQMSGLAEREQGYAILRGRGLPRIDVMGFAHHVSWSALVEQLAGIMESEGPEIR